MTSRIDNHKDARCNHISGLGYIVISGNGHLSAMLKDLCSWVKIDSCKKTELEKIHELAIFSTKEMANEAIAEFKKDCKNHRKCSHNKTNRRAGYKRAFTGSNGY